MRTRALALAVILAVNAGVFMVGVSCLPDIAPATVAPIDAAGAGDVVRIVPAQCGDGVVDLDAGEQCEPSDAAPFGCAACKIACEDGGLFDETSGHCYFVAGASGKYVGAGSACQNVAAHVVTFASEAEYAKVFAWANDAGAAAFWIGLDYDTGEKAYKSQAAIEEPGWAPRCPGCYAHLDAGAVTFPTPRDAAATGRTCVGAGGTVDDPWFAIPCDVGLPKVTLPVVCEREPLGATAHACNGGTCASARGFGRYLYVDAKVAPKEAFEACKSLDAKLVVFETREEREALARELASFLPRSPIPQIWIGLSRAQGFSVNGQWTWADGKPLAEYALEWANQQPAGGGSWVYMQLTPFYDTQLATVDDGTLKLPYVCEL